MRDKRKDESREKSEFVLPRMSVEVRLCCSSKPAYDGCILQGNSRREQQQNLVDFRSCETQTTTTTTTRRISSSYRLELQKRHEFDR